MAGSGHPAGGLLATLAGRRTGLRPEVEASVRRTVCSTPR